MSNLTIQFIITPIFRITVNFHLKNRIDCFDRGRKRKGEQFFKRLCAIYEFISNSLDVYKNNIISN
mgnify:CR=1 FL=1